MSYLATIIQLMQPAGMDCGKFYSSCAPTDSRTPRIQEGWRDTWRPDDGEFLNDDYCEYSVSDPRMTPPCSPSVEAKKWGIELG